MSPRRDGVDGPRVGDDIDPEEIMPAIELGPAGANGSPMADSLDVSNTHGIPACGLNVDGAELRRAQLEGER